MPLGLVLWALMGALLVGAAPTPSRAPPNPAHYDQKQTGDYNIHVHLQDFQIIALLGGDPFSEEEFEYDYADFTIKPSTTTGAPTGAPLQTGTTTKPPLVEQGNSTAGQIKVQILDPLGIVPGEDVHSPLNGGLIGELSRCGPGPPGRPVAPPLATRPINKPLHNRTAFHCPL
uniref:Spondin domain-containing protein n=1 Tax=Dendroctonus ponderosae TaxID=77166 RepID=A0AAR5PS70_DENPD